MVLTDCVSFDRNQAARLFKYSRCNHMPSLLWGWPLQPFHEIKPKQTWFRLSVERSPSNLQSGSVLWIHTFAVFDIKLKPRTVACYWLRMFSHCRNGDTQQHSQSFWGWADTPGVFAVSASIRTRIDVSFQHRTDRYLRTGPQEMRWSSAAASVYHPFFFTPPPGGFRHRKTVSAAVFISLFIFAQCNTPRPCNAEQFTVRRWLIKHVAQSVAHIDISQASGDLLCHCLLVLRVCAFDRTVLSTLYILLHLWWLHFPLEILR